MYLTPVVSQSYLQSQTLIERSVRFVEWNVLKLFISADLSLLSVCVEFGFVVRSGARLKLWNLHRFVRQRTCAPAGTSWCVQVHLNCDTCCVVYLVGWLITQYSAVLWTNAVIFVFMRSCSFTFTPPCSENCSLASMLTCSSAVEPVMNGPSACGRVFVFLATKYPDKDF